MTAAADRLVAVPPSGPLREAALRLAPHPAQEEFSGRADQTLPLAERDPARHPYVLLEGGEPVAFLVLDETPAAADPTADLLLRGFFVDAAAQGRGVAHRAVAALPDYAPEVDDRGGDALVPAAVIGPQDGALRQTCTQPLPRPADMARKPSPAPRDLPGAAAA